MGQGDRLAKFAAPISSPVRACITWHCIEGEDDVIQILFVKDSRFRIKMWIDSKEDSIQRYIIIIDRSHPAEHKIERNQYDTSIA